MNAPTEEQKKEAIAKLEEFIVTLKKSIKVQEELCKSFSELKNELDKFGKSSK